MILIGRGLDFRDDLEPIGKKQTGRKVLNRQLCSCQGCVRQSSDPQGGRKGRPGGSTVPTPIGTFTKLTISGGDNEGVTPVPIPNTEVKPFSADGTWLVTARESRSPPDPK